MRKKRELIGSQLIAWFLAAASVLAVLYGLGWLIWQGMLEVPGNIARLWALLTTALLPVAVWAGWYFGHTEARGRLAGIDQTVDKVMGAASRTAGLQVETRRALRYTQRMQPPVVVLPNVEIVPRLQDGQGTVIEI